MHRHLTRCAHEWIKRFPRTLCHLAQRVQKKQFPLLQVASLRSLGKLLVLSEPRSRRHAALVAQLLTSQANHSVAAESRPHSFDSN